ncbi:YceI family protein [Phenylobacterium montanum]|uniref:YceI family protein n=1 Tax=Phenylobacterium montanum TaxID=2823693 RepID=A0A975IU76_9CAUL|nr:YceI family protein [Caulobacter sp. S6]QUD87465.1 YceI family protein [Caulobacter sp. S6]
MSAAPRDRYTTVAIVLHWLIAVAIVFQILLGWRMGWAPKHSALAFALFQLHKSVGITILLLSLVRLGWRLVNKPPHVDQPAWEAAAAKIVHVGFYGLMIGLPLTGWLAVSASPTGIPTLLYGAIPWPHVPGVAELAAPAKHVWYANSKESHEILVKIAYLLLALHLGAVAKHQIIDRDRVFAHMAAGAKPGIAEPRLWLTAAAFLAVIGVGLTYRPPLPQAAAAPPPAPIAQPEPPAPAASAAQPASSAPAQSAAAAAQTAEAPLPPAQWTVRKGSSLGFTTTWSGQTIQGRFDRWTADIRFSPDALDKSHIKVEIDLASAATGDPQRDATLPTADWFDVATHPKAVFTAAKFRKTGEGRFVADGTLDLRGVKKPVSLPFTLKIDGKTARARGTVGLDRTAFGVGQGEFASTDSVPAAVQVQAQVTADRP